MSDRPGSRRIPVPRALAADHSRQWRSYDYVYPVISRRAGGLSLGINLNVDAACNFDCIYCQVDRNHEPKRRDVDLDQLRDELQRMIRCVVDGAIWSDEKFSATPLALRRLADIAFSGDGEPTASPVFAQACDLAIEAHDQHRLSSTKIVVITNATRLDLPAVQQAIEKLHPHGGEVWAKLDAGTEAYYQQVDRPRSAIRLDQITTRILEQSLRHPLVIQSMFLAIDGRPPSTAEFAAYAQRLAMMVEQDAQIESVHLYTLARPPAEADLTALNHPQLDSLANQLRTRLPELDIEVYYAPD